MVSALRLPRLPNNGRWGGSFGIRLLFKYQGGV
jgi:hypothetical protein